MPSLACACPEAPGSNKEIQNAPGKPHLTATACHKLPVSRAAWFLHRHSWMQEGALPDSVWDDNDVMFGLPMTCSANNLHSMGSPDPE